LGDHAAVSGDRVAHCGQEPSDGVELLVGEARHHLTPPGRAGDRRTPAPAPSRLRRSEGEPHRSASSRSLRTWQCRSSRSITEVVDPPTCAHSGRCLDCPAVTAMVPSRPNPVCACHLHATNHVRTRTRVRDGKRSTKHARTCMVESRALGSSGSPPKGRSATVPNWTSLPTSDRQ